MRVWFWIVAGLAGSFGWAASAAVSPRPNIVYFITDDMGYADTGFNGCKDIRTPKLDAFARQGAILECLYGQPVCSPTRASLLTGRYPTRTGVYNVVQAARPKPWSLPLSERTLAQELRAAGYTTALCGKWHLGEDSPAHLPTQRGFDLQYGFMGGGIDSFTQKSKGGLAEGRDWYRQDEPNEDTGYSTELIAREACRIIAAQPADKPLFLFVSPNAVHTPWLAPEKYLAAYTNLSAGRQKLAAMTAAVDEAFGQIMAALEAKGLATNTLVIFSSDNGGTSWDNISDNRPLRGGKSDIYEGGFRLASFVWWPGVVPAGSRVREPLHVVDWYPTLTRLAGGKIDAQLTLDGRDIWPVLTRGGKSPHEEILLMGSRSRQSALRVGDWKLLVNPAEFRRPARSKPVELYNLADDVGERRDLAAQQPERVKAMQARLEVLIANPVNAAYQQTEETELLPKSSKKANPAGAAGE